MSALYARALVAAVARRACTQKPCISASLTLSYNWLRVLLSGGTSGNVRRRGWLRRLVYLWGARAQHAVLMRLASHRLPQRATYFADGPIRHHRSWPPPRPRRAVLAILKTRNQLYDKVSDALHRYSTDRNHDRVVHRSKLTDAMVLHPVCSQVPLWHGGCAS